MDRRELLGSVSIFASLGEKEMDTLLQATTMKKMKPKDVLCRKGDPGNQLYGILSGSLKVTATGTDGKEVMFGLMGAGEIIGEIALLTGEPRTATVIADVDATVYALSPRDFASLLANCPRLEKRVASMAVHRLTAA